MYLHIGGDTALNTDEIIGLFDLDGASQGRGTLAYLQKREKDGLLASVREDIMPRSFVITENRGREIVYLSPVTTGTLVKRLSEMGKEEAWIK